MRWKRIAGLVMMLGLLCVGCSAEDKTTDSDVPVTIQVWHYYNGDQKEAFDSLVNEFNETIGKEKGIVVDSYGQGSVTDLENNVMAAIRGDVGASEVPNIFAAYADTAYSADLMGAVVDLRDYLTEDEIALYVDGYIDEGDFAGNGEIKIFPIAKSTEVMAVNKTDWDIFAEAEGVSYEDIADLEGLAETAKRYYEWTDAQTPDIWEDGKALYGRDSMANYMLIGSMQLGVEMFSVKDGKMVLNFEEEVVRKLWDYYYVPFVKGYFAASGRFRSDDMKTGNIIAYTGSCSSASYYPDQVSISDTEQYSIEIDVLPAPQFRSAESYAVQQGAGMVVTKGTEKAIEASMEFLKWFTEEERNIRFSVQAGYLPVKKNANEKSVILSEADEKSVNIKNTLEVAIDIVNENYMYTTKAFENGADARNVLSVAMSTCAETDRGVVEQYLASGLSLEEATEEFCSDEYFKAWFEETKERLQEWE